MEPIDELLTRWRDDLASWAVPPEILAAAEQSPWGLPRPLFERRARAQLTAPSGVSYRTALAALAVPGEVLDVGAGAGAAGLALAARTRTLTAVDADPAMLALLETLAGTAGVPVRLVPGRWPDVAASVPPTDVVVCHHVLYNVADLGPFLAELTGHARRLVVAELPPRHPMAPLNPLWLALHGVVRPRRPGVEDVVAVLAAMGYPVTVRRWRRPADTGADPDELLATTAARLCLPGHRVPELAALLAAGGTGTGLDGAAGDPRSGRDVVTLSWPGTAG